MRCAFTISHTCHRSNFTKGKRLLNACKKMESNRSIGGMANFVIRDDIKKCVPRVVKDSHGRVAVCSRIASKLVGDQVWGSINHLFPEQPISPTQINVLKVHEINLIETAEAKEIIPEHLHCGMHST